MSSFHNLGSGSISVIRCGSFFFFFLVVVVFFVVVVFAFTAFFRFFFVGDDIDDDVVVDSSPSLSTSSLPLEVSSSDVSPDADDDPFVLDFLFLVFGVPPLFFVVVFFVVVDDPLTLVDERFFTTLTRSSSPSSLIALSFSLSFPDCAVKVVPAMVTVLLFVVL